MSKTMEIVKATRTMDKLFGLRREVDFTFEFDEKGNILVNVNTKLDDNIYFWMGDETEIPYQIKCGPRLPRIFLGEDLEDVNSIESLNNLPLNMTSLIITGATNLFDFEGLKPGTIVKNLCIEDCKICNFEFCPTITEYLEIRNCPINDISNLKTKFKGKEILFSNDILEVEYGISTKRCFDYESFENWFNKEVMIHIEGD